MAVSLMTMLGMYPEFSNESIMDKIRMICQKENWSLAQFVTKLNKDEQSIIMDALGEDKEVLAYDWKFWGRPNQIPPEIDWYIFSMIAGRGAGKTRSGAEWVSEVANEKEGRRIALVSRTAADVRDVMITGDSGILNVGHPDNRPEYFTSKRLLVWPNGTQAQAFCTTPDTEVLTDSGWKTYDLLEDSDLIRTLDVEGGGVGRWSPLVAVHTFDVVDESMIYIEGPEHVSLTTYGHRWVVSDGEGNYRIAETFREVSLDDYLVGEEEDISINSITSDYLRYTGIVWCPQTRDGTWLARNADSIPFFTGNSSEEPDQLRGPQFRLSVDTPIPTSGKYIFKWKTMGTLEVGDVVYDEFGVECNVVGVHPIEVAEDSYEVVFDTGYRIKADGGHLWKTVFGRAADISDEWSDVEPVDTRYLLDTLDSGHRIPGPDGVIHTVVSVNPIDPVEMRCITVDSESHLYVVGEGFIPTHNTHAWADEPAAWKHTQDDSGLNAWDNLTIATRLGDNPQIFATTTPKRTPFMYDLLEQEKNYREGKSDEIIIITRGTTMDNIGNLSKKYVNRMLSLYEGTHLAEQELYGQMLEEVDGALWTDGMISDHRVNALPAGQYLKVISVDPSVAEDPNDECGIVVVAASKHKRLSERHAYVLADESIQGSPAVWAQKVVDVWLREQCPVVAEVNQGGALVAAAIHAIDDRVPILTVHAKQGKKLRAEPVALKYEKGQIHHVGVLALTESQMTSWVPGETKKSPDRVDALVHGVTALLIKPPSRLGSGKIRAKRPSQTKLNFKTGKMIGR